MKKEKIKTIVITILSILVLLVILIFVYSKIYNNGFTDGQISVAVEQTQTGNVFIVNNRTIESYPIQQICGGSLK